MSAPPSFDVADFPVPPAARRSGGSPRSSACAGCTRHRGRHRRRREGRHRRPAGRGHRGDRRPTDDARLGSAPRSTGQRPRRPTRPSRRPRSSTVPKETVLTEPSRIVVHGEGGVAYGHQVVEVGAFAEARRRARPHRRATSPTTSRSSSATAPSSRRHRRRLGRRRVQASTSTFRVGRDATSTSGHLGGDLVRQCTRVEYAGPGGEAELSACTSPTPASTRSTASWSTTTCPTAAANVVYKGALQGEGAHTVWIGDVLIRGHRPRAPTRTR
jgi:Fe-S cluster assembly protein SufD